MKGAPLKPETELVAGPEALPRCFWCTNNPIYVRYHDEEWGVPVYDDRKHFEMLILEGAQAGLSWLTVLKRRAGYLEAFADFDVEQVARFTPSTVKQLLKNGGIIRNHLKIKSAINIAQCFIKVQQEFGSFSKYIWGFTNNVIIRSPEPLTRANYRATSAESDALSRDLKKRGFSFVGSTIMYALMQATGLVNDHEDSCFKRGC